MFVSIFCTEMGKCNFVKGLNLQKQIDKFFAIVDRRFDFISKSFLN